MLLFSRLKIGIFAAVAAILTLAACTVTPLESTGRSGSKVAKGISFLEPSSRIDQKVRNAVIDLVGKSDPEPRFAFLLNVKKQSAGTAIAAGSGEALVGKVTLIATFELTDIDQGSTVASGQRTATVTYDRSVSQEYANDRAEGDAETRAARALALKLRPVLLQAK